MPSTTVASRQFVLILDRRRSKGAPVEGLLHVGHIKAMLSEGAMMSRGKVQQAITARKARGCGCQTVQQVPQLRQGVGKRDIEQAKLTPLC